MLRWTLLPIALLAAACTEPTAPEYPCRWEAHYTVTLGDSVPEIRVRTRDLQLTCTEPPRP